MFVYKDIKRGLEGCILNLYLEKGREDKFEDDGLRDFRCICNVFKMFKVFVSVWWFSR